MAALTSPAAAMPPPPGLDAYVIDVTVPLSGNGNVMRIDLDTGERTPVSSNSEPFGGPDLNFPAALAVEAGGDIVLADLGMPFPFDVAGGLMRIDSADGTRTDVSYFNAPEGDPLIMAPSALTPAPGGDWYVVDQYAFIRLGGDAGVIRVDGATGARERVSQNEAPRGGPSFDSPYAIAREVDGTLLVTEFGGLRAPPGVIRVNPVTGERTVLSVNGQPAAGPDFDTPRALAVAPNGDVFVVDGQPEQEGRIIRVDATTGERTLVSRNGAPSGGQDFAFPTGIAMGPDGDLLVTDAEAVDGGGALLRVDPGTGARSLVSANDAPDGPQFVSPWAVALGPAPPPVRCRGREATLEGTRGPDRLRGRPGRDVIAAGDGADVVTGLGGADLICGGRGKDVLRGGPGKDRLFGEGGRDRLLGGSGRDRLAGGAGKDFQRQ